MIKTFKEFGEEREKGKNLKDQGYPHSIVPIYRARHHSEQTFKHMDYVTRSEKFAKEHADHMTQTTGEKHHFIKIQAKSEHVSSAYNPRKYFYHGPETKGKI